MKDPNKKSIGAMNIVLVVVAICLISFTISMIVLYSRTGSIPDTLCTCVFASLGGECGAMAWIKNSKERYKERQWELEDRKDNHKED